MSAFDPIDERAHKAVWVPIIEANFSTYHVYGYDDVPGQRGAEGKVNAGATPPIYGLISVTRRYVGTNYRSGLIGAKGVRLIVSAVGRTEDEAAWARMHIAQAIEGVAITVGGVESTITSFVLDTPITYDDGRYVGRSEFSYSI